MSAHTCHADNCGVVVPRRMFMCKRHWYMLPKAMRDDVWALYVPGQERDWGKVTPEYLDHTMACIAFVAEKESASAPPQEEQP